MYEDYGFAEYQALDEEDERTIESLLDNDEIDDLEEGFMLGALRAADDDYA